MEEKKGGFKFSYLIILLLLVLLVCFLFVDTSNPGKRVELSDVDAFISGTYSESETGPQNIKMARFYYYDGIGYILVEGSDFADSFPNNSDYYFEYSSSNDINRIIEKIDAANEGGANISYDTNRPSDNWFLSLLPTLLIIVFGGVMVWALYKMMIGSNRGAMSFGKSRAKAYASTKVKFADIAGADEEKAELEEVVEFLKNPKKFTDLGARIPKGILLVGNPGTGKTESVMQWAREIGRDIIHVDISASKSMWYGESEKIVKDIFNRYRKLCKRSKLKPILLFNEADAIFSKRRDISSGNSVDQTENTIQNILLEEMEKLEGILIATTNLSDNLDKAFERRFLFKIHFSKPSVEVKCNIWLNKMPALNHNEAMQLASLYDFSGGEIDNVVRKYTMMEIIDGKTPSFETIQKLCNEEKINLPYKKIGFARY